MRSSSASLDVRIDRLVVAHGRPYAQPRSNPYAALALQRRDEFIGRRIDIPSDELTPGQIAKTLTAATGRPVTHQEVPLTYVRTRSADLAAMFEYFTTSGLDVDVAGLRRDYPEVGWHSFAEWADTQDWTTLLAPAPARQ
ncbi:hypothetical protein ACF09Y_34595 [Streptomyces massasporeus]|uniref:hypothetical protein n=1 Tax=Streptomyces massasporeus TaxID=67324 RepID=UPI0036FA29EA